MSALRCWYPAIIVIVVGSLALAAPRAAAENALPPPTDRASPWVSYLQRVDEALARQDVSAAQMAWHDAHGAAVAIRRWEGLIAVGDAALRIGDAAKGRTFAQPTARGLYLNALFRARQQRSLEGVLRTTEAFAALGDRDVVEQGLRIAEQLSQSMQDPRARERVQGFRARWAAQSLSARQSDPDPFVPFPDETNGP